MDDLNFISDVLSQYFFTPAMLKSVEGHFKVRTYNSGEVILNENAVWNSLIIIKNGIIRLYYTLPDGTEVNKCFMKSRDCITSVSEEGDIFDFSAATTGEVTLIYIELKLVRMLLSNNNNTLQFENKILKDLLIKTTKREKSLITMDATSRYIYAIDTMPDIVSHIPQYHLASYLGITPVSLSRIKRIIKNDHK